MATDVSVVVPFFNPGANLEDCLASLVEQTLSRERFEVVLIDDGSTDGSGQRADEWVARHPELLTVHHIEASGGPARPRNVGIDRARGRYIQFLDSDDTLAARALERQVDIADESDADVVVGKLASDFRGIWHPLFRRTVTRKTLADYPLIQNLTVCKMFRRDFLLEHGVRFPEGPHYIEDQKICVQAYAHAQSVAVISDMVCYFYRRRRTGGHNYGDTTIVPSDYFRELEEILDVIDTEVVPAARVPSAARYYRGEMLGRLRGGMMLNYDPVYRREMIDEVRRIATTRLSPEVHEGLPIFLRAQSRLLHDDDEDGLVAIARALETVRLAATTTQPRWHDGRLIVGVDAYLRRGDDPLQLERDGESWLLPASMAPGVGPVDRRLISLADVDVDLATISRVDGQLWSTTHGLSLEIDDTGCPRVQGDVALDPSTVMGGVPLAAGLWDLRLRVMFGGLTRTSPLRPTVDEPPGPPAWLVDATQDPRSVMPYWTEGSPTLALDVDEWMHPLHELIDDPTLTAPSISGRRHLVLAAERIQGPAGATRSAELILTPLESPGPAPVRCAAEIRTSPDGSSVIARIPRLPASSTEWSAWLRIGPLGGTPACELPVRLERSRLGAVTATVIT